MTRSPFDDPDITAGGLGQIVILNGVPRAGKSSIAVEVQNTFPGAWMNLGLDAFKAMTPERYQPGIGLAPRGWRPDLEGFVVDAYSAMYESIAAHSRLGLNVITDDGLHDSYSVPRGILADCAHRLRGLPVLFVGVRCPSDEIVRRRAATGWGKVSDDAIQRFEDAIHAHVYDLEVDTSLFTPAECARTIQSALAPGPRTSVLDALSRA